MKNLSYILSFIFISFLLITCCDKDDINPYQTENDYIGIWSVYEYSSNAYFDFSFGQNIYKFKRVHYYNPDYFYPDTLTTSSGVYSCDELSMKLSYDIYANQPYDSIVNYEVEYKNENIELKYINSGYYEYITLIKRD